MYRVIAATNPFRPDHRVVCEVPDRITLAEALGDASDDTVVAVNGEYISRDEWALASPAEGALVVVTRRPKGVIEGIVMAIVAAAEFVGVPASVGAITGVVQGVVAVASIAMSVLPAVLRPQTPSQGFGNVTSRFGSVTGSANQASRFSPIPKLYGYYRMVPPLAGNIYTTSNGNEQFIHLLLCLGYGPMKIGNVIIGKGEGLTTQALRSIDPDAAALPTGTIRFGNTDVREFASCQWVIGTMGQIKERFAESEEKFHHSLYPYDATMDVVGFPLNHVQPENNPEGDWYAEGSTVEHVVTTEAETDKVHLEFSAPAMYTVAGNGRAMEGGVKLEISYKPFGSGSWTELSADNQLSWKKTITREPLRWTYQVVFPAPGQYDVRVRRKQSFIGAKESKVLNVTWETMTSLKTTKSPWGEDATLPTKDCVLMALRIRNSGQLNGNLDAVSVQAQSVLPVYNSSGVRTGWEATSNPAWIYLDAVRGPQVQYPLDANRIDWPEIVSWAAWCPPNNITYNWYHTEHETTLERIKAIAATGRAAWMIIDNKLSVTREFADYSFVPKQMFTPRNSRNLEVNKTYKKLPDAFRVRHIDGHLPGIYDNPSATWTEVETILYRQGFSASNAVVYEVFETQGITTPAQAMLEADYFMRSLISRPEHYTFETDFECLAITRGDCFTHTSDVIDVGIAWGRITQVARNGSNEVTSITLDEKVTFNYGLAYGARIRMSATNRAQTTRTLANPATLENPAIDTNVLTFATPFVLDDVQVGNLVTFGNAGEETRLLKVTGMEFAPDLSATITAVAAAPNLLNEGDYEPYDHLFNLPPQLLEPERPRQVFLRFDSDTIKMGVDGTPTVDVQVSWILPWGTLPIDSVEVMYWVVFATVPPANGTVAGSNTPEAYIASHDVAPVTHVRPGNATRDILSDLPQGRADVFATLSVVVRSRSIYGRYSDWSEQVNMSLANGVVVVGDGRVTLRPLQEGNLGSWMEDQAIDAEVFIKHLSVKTLAIDDHAISVPRHAQSAVSWEDADDSNDFTSPLICGIWVPPLEAFLTEGRGISLTATGCIHNQYKANKRYSIAFYRDNTLLNPGTPFSTSVASGKWETITGTWYDPLGHHGATYYIALIQYNNSDIKRKKTTAHLSLLLHEARK